MESNDRLRLAQKLIEETGMSLFLTGKAGTGKTTFLRELRSKSRKRIIVTAPTGIAAINAGGMTLHSFFQLDFGPFVPGAKRTSSRNSMAFSKEKIKIIRGLDLLVIDEISMVRSDMLDAVDDVLRRFRDRTLPFGGVQLLLIGDLQQLPPVVTESERPILEANYRSPYFFDSQALAQLDYLTIELNKVYRQSDKEFLDLLNAVRTNRADSDVLNKLNRRYIEGFNPDDSEGYVRLTTHNHLANSINRERMQALKTESHFFKAQIEGNFPPTSYPAEEDLELKVGAQVMFLKNDCGMERQFYNGMLGRVTAIDDNEVVVTTADDQVTVGIMEWENIKYEVDEETKEIVEKREGSFRQLPLKAAWAITIHKSQGLTFDKAIIDASMSFTHGQTYVALSRCRTLEGMVLERPIPPQAIITDWAVTQFMDAHSNNTLSNEIVDQMAEAYRLNLIDGMFNFNQFFISLEGVTRVYQEDYSKLYPEIINELMTHVEDWKKRIFAVGERFRMQINRIVQENKILPPNDRLEQRVKDASKYFYSQVKEVAEYIATLPTTHDSSKVMQRLLDRIDMFNSVASILLQLEETFAEEEFNPNSYLDVKAAGAFKASEKKKRRKSIVKEESQKSTDNLNPKLFDMLHTWRAEKASNLGVPAYTILKTKTLLSISNHVPEDSDQLKDTPGMGATTYARHGTEILEIIEKFKSTGTSIERLPLPKKEKESKTKGDSARLTIEMFLQRGLSIEEICKERGLKSSTIYEHISSSIDVNKENIINRLMTEEERHAIISYFNRHEELPDKLSELREAIKAESGIEPEYYQIKVMLRHFKQ